MLASASLLLFCCCWFRCRFYPHFSPSIVGVILIESDLLMANIEISGHDAQVNWIRRIHDFPVLYRICVSTCLNTADTAANVRNGETDQTSHHLPPVRSLKMKASQHKMPPNDHVFSIYPQIKDIEISDADIRFSWAQVLFLTPQAGHADCLSQLPSLKRSLPPCASGPL